MGATHLRRPGAAAGSVVLAALLAALTAGCGLFDDDSGRLALVGDSITDQSRDTFEDRLGDDWRLDVAAVPGDTIAQQQAALEAAVAASPDAVVVNLGTNDVLADGPLPDVAADLEAMVDTAAQVPCPFVVTVNEHMFQFGDDIDQQARNLNDELRAMAEARDVGVIDWSAEVGRQLDAGEPDGRVTVDTVHPTDPFGEELLVTLYADALEDCDA